MQPEEQTKFVRDSCSAFGTTQIIEIFSMQPQEPNKQWGDTCSVLYTTQHI